MRDLNNFSCSGTVERVGGSDVGPSGSEKLPFVIRIESGWTDKSTGEAKTSKLFLHSVAWGDVAKENVKRIQKDAYVFATGRLTSWKKQDGNFETQLNVSACKVLTAPPDSPSLAKTFGPPSSGTLLPGDDDIF